MFFLGGTTHVAVDDDLVRPDPTREIRDQAPVRSVQPVGHAQESGQRAYGLPVRRLERSIVILREMQGLEYEEVSKILKIPLGSVKSKLSRAREKLKAKLMKKMGEEK